MMLRNLAISIQAHDILKKKTFIISGILYNVQLVAFAEHLSICHLVVISCLNYSKSDLDFLSKVHS